MERRSWRRDDFATTPGVLITNRPLSTGTPSILDVAPTVLQHFGVTVPADMDGRPLF